MAGWKKITPSLASIGALTQDGAFTKLKTTQDQEIVIAELEAQLKNLKNQMADSYDDLWQTVKRVRSAVKGIYGDDSSEYEMVGGTRLSERKRPSRKTPPAEGNG